MLFIEMDNFRHVKGVNKLTKSVGGWLRGVSFHPSLVTDGSDLCKSSFILCSQACRHAEYIIVLADFDSMKTHIYQILHVFNLDTVSHYH